MKFLKWLLGLFKKKQHIDTSQFNLKHPIDLLDEDNKLKRTQATLSKVIYKRDNLGILRPYTKTKTVNIYAITKEGRKNEISRKQKLYELGLW